VIRAHPSRSVGALETLARWWTSATQEARYALYARAIQGDREAPRLETLRLAIYLAETEAGETG
jgi:hypothetical protein